MGSIEKMRAMGVTLVAVSPSDYEKFRLLNLRPQVEEVESYARRKEFYDNLLRNGELLFERERRDRALSPSRHPRLPFAAEGVVDVSAAVEAGDFRVIASSIPDGLLARFRRA